MKINRLKRRQWEMFSWMDPFQRMDRLDFPNTFAFAATQEDADGEEDMPAGLLIGSIRADQMIVEWLFVAEEFRKQGVGDRLLSTAVNMAEEKQLLTVAAYISKEYGEDYICEGSGEYLEEHLFQKEEKLPGQWLTNLDGLSKSIFFKEKPRTLSEAIPLCRVDSGSLRAVVTELENQTGTQMLYPVAGEEMRFEQSLSALMAGKEGVRGGLLIQKIGDTLYPICLSARSLDDVRSLLYFSMMAAKEKYPGSMKVRILVRNEIITPLVDKLLPDKKIEEKYLTVSVDEYQKERKIWENLSCAMYNQKLEEMIQTQLNGTYFLKDYPQEKSVARIRKEQDFVVAVEKLPESSLLQIQKPAEQAGSLEELELQQLYAILDWCNERRPCTWFEEDLTKLPITWFEPEISSYVKLDQNIVGVLLIHPDESGRLWIEYLMSAMPQERNLMLQMLRYSAQKVIEKYEPETEIVIRCHAKEISLLVEKFFQ